MRAFEKRYVDREEIDTGPLSARKLDRAWLLLSLALLALLLLNAYLSYGFIPLHIAFLMPLAFVFARIAAVDLCYLLILNIYTIPLFFTGLIYHISFGGLSLQESLLGALVAGLIGIGLSLFMALLDKQKGEFGLGDVKMLLVMGAWVGLGALAFAFAIAFIMNLIIAFMVPRKQAIPFGFGLVFGTWVMVAFKEQFMNALFYFFA